MPLVRTRCERAKPSLPFQNRLLAPHHPPEPPTAALGEALLAAHREVNAVAVVQVETSRDIGRALKPMVKLGRPKKADRASAFSLEAAGISDKQSSRWQSSARSRMRSERRRGFDSLREGRTSFFLAPEVSSARRNLRL